MHVRVPCGWKSRAVSALPVVNLVPGAKAWIVPRKKRKRVERPDPQQKNMIRFGTGRACVRLSRRK
jgi:hypothetical protein